MRSTDEPGGLADDMGMMLTVAPREIHDLAYRASRVGGCDPGTAERIAENVTFAEIHHGAAVQALCEALAAGDLPKSVWATAPDALLAAEVTVRDGHGSATLDPGVPLAAIAGNLWQCLQRGVAVAGIDAGARGNTTVRSVELHEIDDEASRTSRARVAHTHDHAHRFGVDTDRGWFERLEAAAAGFLVAESTLDRAD